MTTDPLLVRGDQDVRQAARRMAEREVMGALVEPRADEESPGVLTARDTLRLAGQRVDPGAAVVAEHCTPDATTGDESWSLERAAEAMIEGGFRHLVVTHGHGFGVVSIRDIVEIWTRGRAWRRTIPIRQAITRDVPVMDGESNVDEAAREMVERGVGAALVRRREGDRPRLVTEQEVLTLLGSGRSAEAEQVRDHLAERMTYSAPDWSLKQAAEAMINGRFQHVVVVDRHGTEGIVSMRDVLRRWLD